MTPLKINTVLFLCLFCLASQYFLPWDYIASEPDTRAVSGYSIARGLVAPTCLSVQKKGIFIVPHDFYEKIQHTEPPLRADCPYFLMVDEPALQIPEKLKLYPEKLDQYGVAMYKRVDLEELLQKRQQNK